MNKNKEKKEADKPLEKDTLNPETQTSQKEDIEINQEEVLKEDILQNELEEAKEKYLRLYSEFENFRRRTTKEKAELITRANRELLRELLPVIDDFERAQETIEKQDKVALEEGMKLIYSKMVKTITSNGLQKMKIKQGDKFNDEIHEAITQIPAKKSLEGKVVDVVENGYTLNDAIVRFAKVVVGSKK